MSGNCKDSHLYKKIFHTLSVGRFSFLLLFYNEKSVLDTRSQTAGPCPVSKSERQILLSADVYIIADIAARSAMAAMFG